MIKKSQNDKIVVYTKFNNIETESIGEVCLLWMKGSKIKSAYLIGESIDENDPDLISTIIETESSDIMTDLNTTFKLKNSMLNDVEYSVNFITRYIKKLKREIVKSNTFMTDSDEQYVIYHDNTEHDALTNFYDVLCDHIENDDHTVTPILFKQIFSGDSNLKIIFSKYGYNEINYVEDSAFSNAAHTGIAFDFSLGYV